MQGLAQAHQDVIWAQEQPKTPQPPAQTWQGEQTKAAVEHPCCADGHACADQPNTDSSVANADTPASSNTKAHIHALEDNINAWEGYEDWAAWDL